MVDQRLTIGAVLSILQSEFPEMDVTISKIRFLEAEGLVDPGRTPTGYRKFSTADVDRLRYTLTMQRDHFLPLRVIRDHLEKIDQGWDPPTIVESAPRVVTAEIDTDLIPAPSLDQPSKSVTMSVTELAEQVDLTVSEVVNLRKMKMISEIPGTEDFGMDALEVARGIAALKPFGIEARHLRPVFNAADRQVELISGALGPDLAGTHATEESGDIRHEAQQLAAQLLRLQSLVTRSLLAREFDQSG